MSAREIALIMFASLLVTAIAACVGARAWLAGSLTAGLAIAHLEGAVDAKLDVNGG